MTETEVRSAPCAQCSAMTEITADTTFRRRSWSIKDQRMEDRERVVCLPCQARQEQRLEETWGFGEEEMTLHTNRQVAAAERLLAWARTRECLYTKCYRPATAMTSTGGLEFFCADHAAEVRASFSGIALIDLPPLSDDVERARDSAARRRPFGPQVT